MEQFVTFPAMVTGLTSQGTNAARPTVFNLNGELYLYNGGKQNAWKWNTTTEQWDVDTLVSTFDVAPGNYLRPCAFYYNSELYLFLGNGVPLGYKWSNANNRWEQNAAISAGITVTSSQNSPTVFFIDSIMYLILGNYTGLYQGFQWNGTQWIENTDIISGLVDSGASIMPAAFYIGTQLYLVANGNYSFKWNTNTNQWDSSTIGDNLSVSTYQHAAFEKDGYTFIISGSSGFVGSRLQSSAKITSLTPEPGENLKAKLTVNLSEPLDSGDILTAYNAPDAAGLGNPLYLVELTQKDSLTWEYQTNFEEGIYCYFRTVQTWNGEQLDTADFEGNYFILPSLPTTVINITDPNNYRILNSPSHNWNHGSLFYNDFVYGSARNNPVLGDVDIFKIEAADYSNLIQQTTWLNKNTQTDRISKFDQIIIHKDFIWTHSGEYLVRINPSDLDYMIFSGLPAADHSEPLTSDSDNIYLTSGLYATKLDSSLLIGAFATYGYDGTAAVTVPPAAILETCTFIQNHPTEIVYCHSALVDNLYLYINQSTPEATATGYDDSLSINMCHVQKIRKTDMTFINDVVTPLSTDDMTQNAEYLFLCPELSAFGAKTYQLGYTWGLFAINKQTFEIKYLKALKPKQKNNGSVNAGYGVFYFNDKIVVQQSYTPRATIVLDISEIESWGDNFPIAGATETIFTFELNGSVLLYACNELNLDNAGYVHTNTWQENTLIFKFPLNILTPATKTPVIQTVLISSGADTATIQGSILDPGQSPITAVGFRYGTDADNLSINVPATLGTTFQEILNTIPPGIYYIQAWGTNTEGTFYGNTVIFSTYNVVTLRHDNDNALLSWINKNYGCSIRCVQDAAGVADGTSGTATDASGNTYNTIVINGKRWFVENLNAEHFRNGEAIPEVIPAATWEALNSAGRCKY